MTQRAPSSTIVALAIAGLGAAFAYACGGSAERTGFSNSAGASGSGTGGGSATGGANSRGGSGGSGGTGGGISSGGSGGGISSGGSGGGTLADRCQLPKDSGPCDAAIAAYFHNARTGVCEPFVYGGCPGNANVFKSEAECQAACSGGTPNFDECDAASDCTVRALGCCGTCGGEGRESLIAINRRHLQSYVQTTGCSGVACGPCPPMPELERQMQYFTATCENRQCRVVDVRETELTDCTGDEDCRLRNGSGCCEGCSTEGWAAVNINADFGQFCGNEVACPACASQPPKDFAAACPNKKCAVVPIPY